MLSSYKATMSLVAARLDDEADFHAFASFPQSFFSHSVCVKSLQAA